ncbi:MAG: PDZ domain-containing protein [Thermodesulfobacteriota bacterium]
MKRLIILLVALTFIFFGGILRGEAQMTGGGTMGHGMTGGKETEQKARLGILIQNITPEIAQSMNLKDTDGVLVSDVIEGGPADTSGINSKDIVKEIDGKEIRTVEDLLSIIGEASPGDEISLKVSRQGEESSIKVRLGSAKEVKVGGEMGHGMMGSGIMSPKHMGKGMGEMMGEMMQGMMKGMMEGMKGMMHDMMGKHAKEKDRGCFGFQMGMMGGHKGYGIQDHKKGFLTPALKERLQLDDEQTERIKDLENNYRKESIRLHAEIKIGEIDIQGLLGKDEIDMNKVEKKAHEIEDEKADLRLLRIQALKDFKGLLSEEQNATFKSMRCFD